MLRRKIADRLGLADMQVKAAQGLPGATRVVVGRGLRARQKDRAVTLLDAINPKEQLVLECGLAQGPNPSLEQGPNPSPARGPDLDQAPDQAPDQVRSPVLGALRVRAGKSLDIRQAAHLSKARSLLPVSPALAKFNQVIG
jgi:hypothetical protein